MCNRGSVGNAMVVQPEHSVSAQAYPGWTVAYFGLVTCNTSLVAKGTAVQNVTLPRPLVPYTQLQYPYVYSYSCSQPYFEYKRGWGGSPQAWYHRVMSRRSSTSKCDEASAVTKFHIRNALMGWRANENAGVTVLVSAKWHRGSGTRCYQSWAAVLQFWPAAADWSLVTTGHVSHSWPWAWSHVSTCLTDIST